VATTDTPASAPTRARPRLELVHDEVPKRLRAAREERKIGVREMARRLDVTASAISQIETGRTRPSVSMLYAMVQELGMSLDELFEQGDGGGASAPSAAEGAPTPAVSDGDDTSGVQRADARTKLVLETGVRWERLTPSAAGDVDFLFVTYPPGSATSVDGSLMRHAGHEYGLVLSGELEVTVGFDRHVLQAGDSITFASTTPHLLRNATDQPVTGVWCVLGRRGSDWHTEPHGAKPVGDVS